MTYTHNPEHDALRHDDAMEAGCEAKTAAYERVVTLITALFEALPLAEDASKVTVPYCTGINKHSKSKMPIMTAIGETIGDDDEIRDLLDIAIAKSTCPHVVAVRSAIAAYWVRHYADGLSDIEGA